MERTLARIDKNDHTAKDAAFEALRKEFYPKEEAEYFIDRNRKFSVPLIDFLEKPYSYDFGGDVYGILDDVGVVGASQIKYYRWDLIKPQLYFNPEFNADGSIRSLSLSPLADLVKVKEGETSIPEIAAELAYYWVRPDMRGRGLGKDLFNQPFDELVSKERPKSFLFTTTMGNSTGKGAGKTLMNFILEKNKIANGLSQDGKVIVRGVSVSWSEVASLGLNPEMFEVREASRATKTLALKYGMKFYGYSKNLSPTFGLVK